MAAAIKKGTGFTPEYIKSGGGLFEIVVDGNLIYSKKQTGQFPVNDAIVTKINALK